MQFRNDSENNMMHRKVDSQGQDKYAMPIQKQ